MLIQSLFSFYFIGFFMKLLLSCLAILFAVIIYVNVIENKPQLDTVAVPKEASEKISPAQKSEVYNQWLTDQFEEKHQNLMPFVAVADMFWACNKQRQSSAEQYSLKYLVNVMDKNILARKLATCLDDDEIKSETALNFGLLACFSEQLKALPEKVQAEKIKIVEDSFLGLSYEQRQKSFTKCISEQAMEYL
jgi:hypothetical protein